MRKTKTAYTTIFTVFLSLLLTLSSLAMTSHATPSIQTYVLGVTSPTDSLILDLQSLTTSLNILPGISGLTLVGTNSILFVNGQWLQTAASLDPTVLSLVTSKALSGIPTIVIRGSPSLLADSISGLLSTKAVGLPLISDGVQVFGTLPDGTRQAMVLQVLAGFDYAVQAEFTWAQSLLSQQTTTLPSSGIPLAKSGPLGSNSERSPTPSSTISGGGSFTLIGEFVTDTGNAYAPVGRFSYNFTLFRLQNSGSTDYKWDNFFFNETLQPGSAIYNNNWRTSGVVNQVTVVNQTSNFIVSHGPQPFGTTGPSSISYTIGVNNGTLAAATTANQTATYSLKNTQVTDLSQNGFNVGWEHDINSGTSAGKLTFSIIPGWTDRIRQDNPVNTNFSLSATASFVQDHSSNTQSIVTTFDVQGG